MKRGQLTLETMGKMVLVLLVVAIVALLIRQFVTGGGERLGNLSESARFGPDKCANIALDRACYENCTDGLRQVPGTFKDCQPGEVCCERT